MDRGVYERMNEQEADHWWFAARRDLIRTAIDRIVDLPAEARILEAGCGTGGNLGMLAEIGSVDAFEYDEDARRIASEKSGLDVLFGALPDEIPFGQAQYDLIGLFDVLEHVEAHVESLAALGARLAPGGALLVTVPALPALWSKHDERHHHFRRYTRKSLAKAADEAGLNVQTSFYFNSLLLPVAVGMRAAKARMKSDAPDDTMPAPWLNRALYSLFSSERHLLGRAKLPLGLSLCGVMRRGVSE